MLSSVLGLGMSQYRVVCLADSPVCVFCDGMLARLVK